MYSISNVAVVTVQPVVERIAPCLLRCHTPCATIVAKLRCKPSLRTKTCSRYSTFIVHLSVIIPFFVAQQSSSRPTSDTTQNPPSPLTPHTSDSSADSTRPRCSSAAHSSSVSAGSSCSSSRSSPSPQAPRTSSSSCKSKSFGHELARRGNSRRGAERRSTGLRG